MKKIQKQCWQYILDEQEAKLVRECLLYCRHRLKNHKPYCGLGADLKEVERLLEEFGKDLINEKPTS
jgi:hypothetical protein